MPAAAQASSSLCVPTTLVVHRIGYQAVDVCLGGEMNDDVLAGTNAFDEGALDHVILGDREAEVVGGGGEIGAVAGIRERVEDRDRAGFDVTAPSQQRPHAVRAVKPAHAVTRILLATPPASRIRCSDRKARRPGQCVSHQEIDAFSPDSSAVSRIAPNCCIPPPTVTGCSLYDLSGEGGEPRGQFSGSCRLVRAHRRTVRIGAWPSRLGAHLVTEWRGSRRSRCRRADCRRGGGGVAVGHDNGDGATGGAFSRSHEYLGIGERFGRGARCGCGHDVERRSLDSIGGANPLLGRRFAVATCGGGGGASAYTLRDDTGNGAADPSGVAHLRRDTPAVPHGRRHAPHDDSASGGRDVHGVDDRPASVDEPAH